MSADPLDTPNQDQFRKKAERRRALAKLSIEEKLKRLVQLQRVAYTIGLQSGRKPRKPWGTTKTIEN